MIVKDRSWCKFQAVANTWLMLYFRNYNRFYLVIKDLLVKYSINLPPVFENAGDDIDQTSLTFFNSDEQVQEMFIEKFSIFATCRRRKMLKILLSSCSLLQGLRKCMQRWLSTLRGLPPSGWRFLTSQLSHPMLRECSENWESLHQAYSEGRSAGYFRMKCQYAII